MLHHKFVRSLTVGACLVAAAALAFEPLPDLGEQGEDAVNTLEILPSMPVVPGANYDYNYDYGDDGSVESLQSNAGPGGNGLGAGVGPGCLTPAPVPTPHFGPPQGPYPTPAACQEYEEGGPTPCQIHCWNHWGYPGENLPLPMGVSYYTCQNNQILNGMAAQMVLYRYDFQQPKLDKYPSHLGAHGHLRLAKLATRLGTTPVPLLIETTGDPALDAARRQYVLDELNKFVPGQVPDHAVVLGVPRGRALRGVEALIMDDNLMLQTRARGMSQLPSIPGRILSPIQAAPNVNNNDDSR